jgi:outer membrane protein, heavy metal efflux system
MKFSLKKLSVVLLTGICFIVGLSVPAAVGETIQRPAALAALIDEGLANNQGLQSLAFEIKSLEEEISVAGALDDPRLGIALLNLPTDSFRFDQEPMTQKQLFIAQKIPWFGKLSLRTQRAVLKVKQKEAVLAARQLALSKNIAADYYELGFIASSQKINQRLIETLKQLLRVSETKYAAGQGLQQDVLHAQVELSKLLDEEIELMKNRRTLENRINALLNRESFASIEPPENPGFPGIAINVETLKDQALSQNPWLQARQVEIDQSKIEIGLSKKDYWPDMDFKVAYGQRDESQSGRDWADFVSASVVVNLPVWKKNRQDKRLASRKQSHESALKSYRELAQRLPFEIDALVGEIDNLQKNYKLYADALLVQAEQWAHASLAAYGVGKLEFNPMISAQIRLLRFEIKANRYLFSIYRKHAELEEISGSPIALQTDRGDSPDLKNKRTSLKHDEKLMPGLMRHTTEMYREDDGENPLPIKENVS